jgi:AdoMet-dependent rRNA methyltransferase SPB1
MNVPGDL